MRFRGPTARAVGWAVCAAIWLQASIAVPLGALMQAEVGFDGAVLCTAAVASAGSPAGRSGPSPTRSGAHDHDRCLLCSPPVASAAVAVPLFAAPNAPAPAVPHVPADRVRGTAGTAAYVSRAPPLNA